ncbi:conserved hypothetical protein [Catenulispora acidiphila DSM 44928]|uniref:Tetratricopeptide repeat protein n=1 Tax=Catenulispora acidiphila (strain DSM 44928 / JCM 14897 / NBRC 102108 / NRRL B-24433 / ID139908) TaxID=479433 RepID=C7QJP1_CATAD|nr:hypothetical protein [Catenulispora acidiphila]ACU71264.1 conserved hypothetical protein [Catenulispora acidiphila DSM 44928]
MIADTAYIARRLQQLGDWDAALAVLGPDTDPELRAEIAVERWFFRWSGHAEAEQAVAALDQSTPAAHVLRARLAYSRLVFDRDPRPDDRAAAEAGYRDAVCDGDEPIRGWAEFHWGCLLDNVDGDADGAAPHFETALEIGLKHRDPALESIALRHLSAQREPEERIRMLRRSLNLRAALGVRPYIVAAQATLASELAEDDPERAELTELYSAAAEEMGIAWLLGGGTGKTEEFED